MKPTLLILAAGMGNRYGGLKQIDGFGPHQETLLEYAVYDALKAGFGKIVFIIRESFAEEFKTVVLSKLPSSVRWALVFQPVTIEVPGMNLVHREKPRGVAHAVLVAKDTIKEPFAVINADDYYGTESFQQMHDALHRCGSPTGCCMVSYVLKNTLSNFGTVNRGVCKVDTSGMLVDVQEYYTIERMENGNGRDKDGRELSGESPVSMNFRGFHPSFFDYLEREFTSFLEQYYNDVSAECVLPRVVDKLIKQGTLMCHVITTHSQWCGVTNPEDKQVVKDFFQTLVENGVYPSPLRSNHLTTL